MRPRSRVTAALVVRLAARFLARNRVRNGLIAAMIVLPVMGMTAFGTVYASSRPTPAESLGYELGQTQAWVSAGYGAAVKQDPSDPRVVVSVGASGGSENPVDVAPSLPVGNGSIRIDETTVVAKTKTGIGTLSTVIGRSWDPSLTGRYTVVSGRTPTEPDEAMVSAATLGRLGINVGQQVVLTRPSASYTVVGIIDDEKRAADWQELFIETAPSATNAADDGASFSAPTYYLTGAPVSWSSVQKINAAGGVVLSRDVVLHPPSFDDADVTRAKAEQAQGKFWASAAVLLIGIFGLLQIGLLAAAAFMVGARQQQRTFAILASIGAEVQTIRSIISLGGLLVGAVGAIIGTVVGIGAGAVIMALTRDGSASQYPAFHVDPFISIAIVVLAVLASWLAASIPARRAARLDVVSALRGASRPLPPRRRTPIIGVALVVLGASCAVVGGVLFGANSRSTSPWALGTTITLCALGPITILIGVILIAPAILRQVGRAFSLLGVAARIAARDAARNAARTVPAIAAVSSSVFVAAFGACVVASAQAGTDSSYSYNTAAGEVSVSLLNYQADGTATLDPAEAVADALNSAIPLTHLRALSSAGPGKDGTAVQVAVADRFLCPWDPRVAGFREHLAEASETAPCNVQPSGLTSASPDGYTTNVMVGSADDLALILGEPVTPASLSALEAGEAVSLYPQFLTQTQNATLKWWPINGGQGYDGETPSRTATVPAVVQRPEHDTQFGIFVTPQTATALGIEFAPSLVLSRASKEPTQQQLDAANGAISAVTGDPYRSVTYEDGPGQFAAVVTLTLVLISTVVSLAAAAAAIGLARSDGRRDDAILSAVGSPPMLRRAFGFWQAVIIAGLGSAVGVVLGIAEFVALTIPTYVGLNGGLAPAAPVMPLTLIAVGIPAIIAIGAWLGTRRGRTTVMDRSVIT